MADQSLSFNPRQVTFTFMGVLIKGYADGVFIEVTRDEDSYTKVVGAAGDGARIKTNNKAGKVKLTLLQTSLSNDVLSGAQQLDELSGTGHGALAIKDLNGASLVFCAEAWLMKPVDVKYGKDHQAREWTFDTLEMQVFAGGNA